MGALVAILQNDANLLRCQVQRLSRHVALSDPPERAADMIIGGSPEQCIEKLQRYVAMGFDEFMLITLEPFDDDELECFAERVLPAFAAPRAAGRVQVNG